MAGKGKLKVDVKAPKVDKYKVSGTTLEEIWNDIQAKGPKDGGKARAGYTTAPVETPKSINFDGETDPKKKGASEYEATVWYKSGTITITPVIQMPELASDKELSDEDKKTWKAYVADLRAHEQEHVEATKKEAEKIAKELSELEGKAKGKDTKEAIKKAQEAFDKELKKNFDQSTIDDRVKEVNKKLDTGGHGPVLKFKKK